VASSLPKRKKEKGKKEKGWKIKPSIPSKTAPFQSLCAD